MATSSTGLSNWTHVISSTSTYLLLIVQLYNSYIFKSPERAGEEANEQQTGYTNATVPAPALRLNGSNSCGLVEIHGAETLLFLVFAANVSTHTGAEPCDTHKRARPHTPVVCVNPRAAGRPQLFSLSSSLFAHCLLSFVALRWALV